MKTQTLLEAIGNTPLVNVFFKTPATILAKLEYLNPGGSLKDRSALFMIEEAEKNGILKPGGTLIEASTGNQGIATAMIGALKGYNVIITTTNKFSTEKLDTIRAYGAEIIMCPITEHLSDQGSYHSTALTLHNNTPNSFLLNQYYSLANSHAHYHGLGPELWKQTQGNITHFFAAAGSCGTITGVGRFLKEQNKDIKVIACDAATSYRATQGRPQKYRMEGIGVDYATPLLAEYQAYIDDFVTVTDEQGLAMLKTMAHTHGILCGPSSGAVAFAVEKYSKNSTRNDIIAMIMGDSGRAYLSKGYYC